MGIVVNLNVSLNLPGIVETIILLTQAIQENNMAGEIDALREAVSGNSDLINSAIATIRGLADQVESLKNDPAALQAMVDELRQKDAELAAAIPAGTPAEPTA